ncbi:hypothetical protein BKM04_18315 [Pseudomonas syringae pv. syringae]|nr:hypothetical protein BKM04_18315 [Pseudomonas syringae pv. syringae]POD60471.1 hypothetical protein BKM06_16745 [Pseudomonas syringae pv. syringae]
MGTRFKIAVTATEMLFEHHGTDNAECDVSDRAKEPDEVGPETGAGTLLTLVPQSESPRGEKVI